MIALFLGTSEGKRILTLMNKYTDDLYVSTATEYGGELLKEYRYRFLNTRPLDKTSLEDIFKENSIEAILDASHPYAVEISQNLASVAKKLKIEYIRYERPSVLNKYKDNDKVIFIEDYADLKKWSKLLEGSQGSILNTTGSRNIEKIMAIKLNNRIIHRVLPTVSSIEKCVSSGVKVEDIIAIKGPSSMELNECIIKEYNASAIILKDSGTEGGTEEKIQAALKTGVYAFVIKRKMNCNGHNVVSNVNEAVEATIKFLDGKRK